MMDQADSLLIDGSKTKLVEWIKSTFSNIPENLSPERIQDAQIADEKLILTIN
jgi:hypothetical protein